MNLLGFFAIIVSVTGLVWILKIIFKSKYRINVDFSITIIDNPAVPKESKEQPLASPPSDNNSVMGGAKTVVKRNAVEQSDQQEIPKEATPNVEPPKVEPPKAQESESSTQTGGNEESNENPDAYLDKVYKDVDLETHTNESILNAVGGDLLNPPLGHVTFSGTGQIAAQLPPDSFDKPQNNEQVAAMFNLLQETISRIEGQMIAIYAIQQAALFDSTPTSEKSVTDDDSGDNVSFGDDDSAQFGGGFDQQLAKLGDKEDEAPLFLSMEEAGVPVPDDAFQTYDASEAFDNTPDEPQPVEALAYMANLNQTGQLAHDVVVAVKTKLPAREVKHRVLQVLRALDKFRLSNDANAAIRVTAVMRSLDKNLGAYDNDIASIGRKFGVVAPESEPEPVEAE